MEGNTLPVKSRFAGKGNETLRRCFDNAFRLHHPVLDVALGGRQARAPDRNANGVTARGYDRGIATRAFAHR